MLQLFSNQKKAGQRTKAVVDPSTVVVVVKVSKFPNEPKIVRISALYFGTVQGRNLYNIWFIFWEKRWFHKCILKFTDLYEGKTLLQSWKECLLYCRHICSILIRVYYWNIRRNNGVSCLWNFQASPCVKIQGNETQLENLNSLWMAERAFFKLLRAKCHIRDERRVRSLKMYWNTSANNL